MIVSNFRPVDDIDDVDRVSFLNNFLYTSLVLVDTTKWGNTSLNAIIYSMQ